MLFFHYKILIEIFLECTFKCIRFLRVYKYRKLSESIDYIALSNGLHSYTTRCSKYYYYNGFSLNRHQIFFLSKFIFLHECCVSVLCVYLSYRFLRLIFLECMKKSQIVF